MNNATILIVDDEPQIRKLLSINLESNDYKVLIAENGKEAITEAAMHNPDLVILDLGLPDKSGHEVLKLLREWYQNAIIILSVLNDENNIVMALDNGATDYLTKPFRSAELLARIRSAIRRNNSLPEIVNQIVEGELTIDLVARTIKKQDQIVKVTSTEFNLMALFARNAGRVLTHKYILKEIWGVAYQTETQYLRVFIGSLRKKIESTPERPIYIITESGVGYRFG